MPYRVETLQEVLKADTTDASMNDVLEKALNRLEDEGWTLVNVGPQFYTWDDEGEAQGLSSSYLVFHKPKGPEVQAPFLP